jgi:hypothetical protein
MAKILLWNIALLQFQRASSLLMQNTCRTLPNENVAHTIEIVSGMRKVKAHLKAQREKETGLIDVRSWTCIQT